MNIVMIRHLPTQWNMKGVLQGSKDIALAEISSESKEQIIANKKQLADKYGDFEHVFASALVRTQQTARAYDYEAPTIEPLLNELNFGAFEGRKKSELIAAHSDSWFDSPESIVLGEPLVALKQRVNDFFQKYGNCEQMLVFGHGNWIRSAMSLAQNNNLNLLNKIHLDNNQIVELAWDSKR